MANLSHKRDANARRKPKAALVAGLLAFLATATVVPLGVLAANPDNPDIVTALNSPSDVSRTRDELVSRAGSRDKPAQKVRGGVTIERAYSVDLSPATVARAIDNADTRRWATADLNLWSTPGVDAANVGLLASGKGVLVTGREDRGRQEVVVAGRSRWVTAGYLSEDKPAPAAGTTSARGVTPVTGLSSAPCPNGSTESGLTSSAVLVYRAVCNAFPQITTYGGYAPRGEHASGRALDIMTSDVALGTAIAEFLQANASALNLYDILWRQRIWTPVRASEGWRFMPSRGSATADHYDHVHVSTN